MFYTYNMHAQSLSSNWFVRLLICERFIRVTKGSIKEENKVIQCTLEAWSNEENSNEPKERRAKTNPRIWSIPRPNHTLESERYHDHSYALEPEKIHDQILPLSIYILTFTPPWFEREMEGEN